jgi:hypothetical protein
MMKIILGISGPELVGCILIVADYMLVVDCNLVVDRRIVPD